jgi:alkylated DNA nucleotide flippase Atl1
VKVLKLFLKPETGLPIAPCDRLYLHQGYGIQGDRHAQVGSPRQVLMVDLETLNQFNLQPGDLRENILLPTELNGFESGQVLQLGEARIRLMFRCEPCRYLDTLQPDLVKRIQGQRGWLGMVVQSGAIAAGDPVTLIAERFPGMPDDARGRFNQLVARIPAGRVMTTRDLILAMGVTSAHYRVLPAFIKTAPPSLPVHRIVAIAGNLLSSHLPDQAQQLQAEGVEVRANHVLETYYWSADQFHCCTIQSTASAKSLAM